VVPLSYGCSVGNNKKARKSAVDTVDDELSLLQVVGSLHDSVIDDDKWLGALQQIADFTGGSGAVHIIASPATAEVLHSQSVGLDPVVNERYLQHYAAKDIRIPPAIPLPVGQVVTEQSLVEPRELERSEIYGDLLSPFDIPHVMAAWLRKEAAGLEVVVIEGSHRHGPFSDQAQQRFKLVVPHLVRAVRLRDMLALARRAKHAYRLALESLPFGVIMLNEHGCILDATRAAERTLRNADGLTAVRGRVHATATNDDSRFQRLIHDAVTTGRRARAAGGSIALRSESGSLSVTVIPVSPQELLVSPQPAALLIVVDPKYAPPPNAGAIQRRFGLTKAEAALAAALFDCSSLREASVALGRSINTCKSQLKLIYQKTNCRHHADLAKKLLMTALVSEDIE
jgi:PAS domain-containing protein